MAFINLRIETEIKKKCPVLESNQFINFRKIDAAIQRTRRQQNLWSRSDFIHLIRIELIQSYFGYSIKIPTLWQIANAKNL